MIGNRRASQQLADLLEHPARHAANQPVDTEMGQLVVIAGRLSALPKDVPDPQTTALTRALLVEAAQRRRAAMTDQPPVRDTGRRRAWLSVIIGMAILTGGSTAYSFATEAPPAAPRPPAQVGPVVPTSGPSSTTGGSARDVATAGPTPGSDHTGRTGSTPGGQQTGGTIPTGGPTIPAATPAATPAQAGGPTPAPTKTCAVLDLLCLLGLS